MRSGHRLRPTDTALLPAGTTWLRRSVVVATLALAWPGAQASDPLAAVARQVLDRAIQDELRRLAAGGPRPGESVQRDCSAFAALGGGNAPPGSAPATALPRMPPAPAMVREALERMPPEQRALLAPLLAAPPPPEQVLATLDELGRLGLGQPEDLGLLRTCLDDSRAAPAVALVIGSMRPALDGMRQARLRLEATPPAERAALVTQVAAELRALDTPERQAALGAIGRATLLPAWLTEGLRVALR